MVQPKQQFVLDEFLNQVHEELVRFSELDIETRCSYTQRHLGCSRNRSSLLINLIIKKGFRLTSEVAFPHKVMSGTLLIIA